MHFRLFVDDDTPGVWEREIFHRFAAHLETRGARVEARSSPRFAARGRLGRRHPIELSHCLAILDRPRGGQTRDYWVLDGTDWTLPFTNHLDAFAADRRCRRVLKCQWERRHFGPGSGREKVVPWTYFETHATAFQQRLGELRRRRDARDAAGALVGDAPRSPLYFRGNASWANRRPILQALAARGLVRPDFETTVPYDSYLDELAAAPIALCLPGFGVLCHREIEAFGVGTPVLMPRPVNQLADPLEPDVHYLAVAIDVEKSSPDEVASELAARLETARHDPSSLTAVSGAARAWYDRNVRFPASLELAVRQLELPLPT
ncbi:MAG: hypothetical protein AAGC60_09290 [Acidobacteriota bacterium]